METYGCYSLSNSFFSLSDSKPLFSSLVILSVLSHTFIISANSKEVSICHPYVGPYGLGPIKKWRDCLFQICHQNDYIHICSALGGFQLSLWLGHCLIGGIFCVSALFTCTFHFLQQRPCRYPQLLGIHKCTNDAVSRRECFMALFPDFWRLHPSQTPFCSVAWILEGVL